MIFSSLFFMLFFLPLFLLFYFLNKTTESKNKVLLIFSLIFYCWGGLKYVILLIVMTFVSWLAAKKIYATLSHHERKRWLIIAVAFSLAVLVFFKYTGFFLGMFGSLIDPNSPLLHLALPIGISFYTFKLISYVADVYNGKIEAEENFVTLLTYVSMFHHCVAGPIVRYSTVQHEMYKRKRLFSDISNGIYRCCVGLAKKSILANHCGVLAEQLLSVSGDISAVPVSGVWLGSLCYMLQLFLDFAAYSDIAIGLGWICGFHFEENFNYPYIASSIKDFWRRWHISLSSFFRDYVYIPLGGNRISPKRTVINLLIVWALTGLWHGSSWNYVLWGLFFFVFIFIENKLIAKDMYHIPKPAGHLLTLFIVFIGWMLFRFEDFGQLGTALKGLFGLNGNPAGSSAVGITFINNIFFLIVAVLACTPIFKKLMELIKFRTGSKYEAATTYYAIRIGLSAVLFIISVIALIGNSYSPFLYYQF